MAFVRDFLAFTVFLAFAAAVMGFFSIAQAVSAFSAAV